MKPFNARATGLINVNEIEGFEIFASIASNFYKVIKNKKEYIKVFSFCLATLVSLHRSSELLNIKASLPLFTQCNLATKSHEVNHAPT